MRDFALAISGVLVGGLMTLGGTVLQAKLAAAAEARVELRGKLELLLQVHESNFSCHTEFMASGELSNDCVADRHANRAISLAQIYFPDLVDSLRTYSRATLKAGTARSECATAHSGRTDSARLDACIEAISDGAKEMVEVVAQVDRQAMKLRE